MSSKTKSTKECGGKITSAAHARVQQSTTKLHGCGQTSTTSYNIAENKRNVVSYNICLVKSLIAIKLFTEQMLYDATFLLFSAMLYEVVLIWPPCNFVVLCSTRAWAVKAIFLPHFFVDWA